MIWQFWSCVFVLTFSVPASAFPRLDEGKEIGKMPLELRTEYERIIEMRRGGGLELMANQLRSFMSANPRFRDALTWYYLDIIQFLPGREAETRQILKDLVSASLKDKPLTMMTIVNAHQTFRDHEAAATMARSFLDEYRHRDHNSILIFWDLIGSTLLTEGPAAAQQVHQEFISSYDKHKFRYLLPENHETLRPLLKSFARDHDQTTWTALGDQFFALEMGHVARICYQRALEMSSSDQDRARLHVKIGDVLEEKGDSLRAAQAFLAAYKYDPTIDSGTAAATTIMRHGVDYAKVEWLLEDFASRSFAEHLVASLRMQLARSYLDYRNQALPALNHVRSVYQTRASKMLEVQCLLALENYQEALSILEIMPDKFPVPSVWGDKFPSPQQLADTKAEYAAFIAAAKGVCQQHL